MKTVCVSWGVKCCSALLVRHTKKSFPRFPSSLHLFSASSICVVSAHPSIRISTSTSSISLPSNPPWRWMFLSSDGSFSIGSLPKRQAGSFSKDLWILTSGVCFGWCTVGVGWGGRHIAIFIWRYLYRFKMLSRLYLSIYRHPSASDSRFTHKPPTARWQQSPLSLFKPLSTAQDLENQLMLHIQPVSRFFLWDRPHPQNLTGKGTFIFFFFSHTEKYFVVKIGKYSL